MSNIISNKFENYLNKFSESDWKQAVEKLLPEIHPVDREAVQIWFRFFPLELHRYLSEAEDPATAAQRLAILGNHELKDQIDSSHHFLYGHRYWKVVKAAIEAESSVFESDDKELVEEIKEIAFMVAEKIGIDTSLVFAITAVGFMTVVQAGVENFKNASGETAIPKGLLSKSPDRVLEERSRDDSQGLLGFLRTVDKQFSVSYQTTKFDGKFKIMNDEEIASASAKNQSKDWKAEDDRCWEGVVPVECRSAACGTCWIGVIGGSEKLSEVAPLERRQMQVFGYGQPESQKPFLRLACQARAHGNVSIVIPPWNGVFGKQVYSNVEDRELEPATSSAKANRAIVKEAVKNDLL